MCVTMCSGFADRPLQHTVPSLNTMLTALEITEEEIKVFIPVEVPF